MARLASVWSARTQRMVIRAVTIGLAVYLIAKGVAWAANVDLVAGLVGYADHSIYMSAADRIWAGGPMYPDWELRGPFAPSDQPELYPPLAVLILFLPMSRLPDMLWWAVPISVVAIHIAACRPSALGWLVILACLAAPRTWIAIATG